MNKRILDILVYGALFFLIFTFISGLNKKDVIDGSITFETVKNTYRIPAGVDLSFKNNSTQDLSFNTCSDISLRALWEAQYFPESFCEDKTLKSGESLTLDLWEYYEMFEIPGLYTFKFVNWEDEFISQVNIKYLWTIGKVFVGLFYAPMYNLMAFFLNTFAYSLGFAIIAITLVMRILLLFPQHKMLVSQRKMQAIQPEIKKLQEKYKGKQQEMGMELMKLYKKHGVNPMSSIGLLLLQMPLLIVIYQIILHITAPQNVHHIYSFLPLIDISKIDFNFFGLNLLASGGLQWALLAITVAAIQFAQVKLSLMGQKKDEPKKGVVLEKKKGDSGYQSMMPDPEMMQKFMLYGMPAMVAVFTFTFIAWVWLYWWVSTLFAIIQQIFVNKLLKK